MTGEQNLGTTELSRLSFEEYNLFKERLAVNPDSDSREAYSVINKLEEYTQFLQDEFQTVMQDYLLEVKRSNELHKHLKHTISLLKAAKGM